MISLLRVSERASKVNKLSCIYMYISRLNWFTYPIPMNQYEIIRSPCPVLRLPLLLSHPPHTPAQKEKTQEDQAITHTAHSRRSTHARIAFPLRGLPYVTLRYVCKLLGRERCLLIYRTYVRRLPCLLSMSRNLIWIAGVIRSI